MSKFIAMLVLVGCVGCANVHVNRVALIASTAAILCDAGQTIKMARGGWENSYEANPVMGTHPDQFVVGGYFVTALAANTLAWLVTPERYRAALPTAVVAVQAVAVEGNVRTGTGMCGL
jgi:hypothetical protein